MRCPFCQHPDNRVLESRSAEAGQSVRRRRECLNCGRRFTTYERIEYIPITVIKRNGDRESFDRSKLLKSVILACEKTRTSSLKLEALVDDIEVELQQRSIREVSSSEIGELVLQQLQTINPVAYVRFASIHRQFTQVHDFTEALEHLQTVSLEQRSLESDEGTLKKAGSDRQLEGREEQDTDLEALIRDQLVYNSNH